VSLNMHFEFSLMLQTQENVLLVFSRLQKRKLFEEPLEKIQHTTCLAFSPDEAYIAVGLESTIRIYDIDNPHNLPEAIDLAPTPKSKFKSQRINFSQSGHRVVVATRNGAGDVKIVVFDRAKSAVHWSKTTDAVNTVSLALASSHAPQSMEYNLTEIQRSRMISDPVQFSIIKRTGWLSLHSLATLTSSSIRKRTCTLNGTQTSKGKSRQPYNVQQDRISSY
jgi:hypothetical protein